MDLVKITNQIEEQGFAVVEQVVGPEELSALRQQLDVALVHDMAQYGHLPGKREYIIYDLVTHGGAFVDLLVNETMRRIFSHFLGATCILYSFTSTIMRPGIYQPTTEIHVDTPRLIPNYHSTLLMTLALDDFTPENGSTWYLPGSHTQKERPSDEEFYKGAVRVSRPAGAAVFFNPRVWHAGAPNHTQETRRAVTTYACRSYMRQRFDYPRMIAPELSATLTDSHKAFLGYNVRVPTNLAEYYVPAEERLYKANQG